MKKPILIIITFLITFVSVGQEVLDNLGNPLNSADIIKLKNSHCSKKSGANPATIISVIPSPTQSTSINDIAFDGEYLWVEGFGEYFIHQISTINGSIIKSIPTNVQRPHGLTFDGTYLWLTDGDNKVMQQIDTSNGNVLQSFPTPSLSSASYPGGLAWDGQNLWNNDLMGIAPNPNDSTYKVSTFGQLLQSYHAFGTAASGLAWDGQFLWSTDNVRKEIYKIDATTFSVIDTIDAPGGLYPNGLAFDGQYLWVSNNDADSIYQIDIGYIPTGISDLNLTLNELTIYPNPTSGQLTITSELMVNKINISSLDGKVIKSFQQNTNAINISDLPNGIYFIQLITNDRRINKKFIKQ